jgi:transcriptional regulator with XRE-family HTH domain
VDIEDARTIGARLRRIRRARGKSLRVVAGLAGISKSHLDRIERGERALDSLSEIVALANALQIAPSELTRLPGRLRRSAVLRPRWALLPPLARG